MKNWLTLDRMASPLPYRVLGIGVALALGCASGRDVTVLDLSAVSRSPLVAAADVDQVEIRVEGPGINPAITRTVSSEETFVELDVPPGPDRRFTVTARSPTEGNGRVTQFWGRTARDVQIGSNDVEVVLDPAGDIELRLGSNAGESSVNGVATLRPGSNTEGVIERVVEFSQGSVRVVLVAGTYTLEGNFGPLDQLDDERRTFTVVQGESRVFSLSAPDAGEEISAADDAFTVTTETVNTLDVLANDTFGANGPGGIRLVDTDALSTAAVDVSGTPDDPLDDRIVYTAGTPGTDVFRYEIIDGAGNVAQAEVTVTILAELVDALRPVAVDDAYLIAGNTGPTDYAITANDAFPVANPVVGIEISAPPSNGTASIVDNSTPDNFADDLLRYAPSIGFSGVVSLSYQLLDRNGIASEATVTFNVTSTGLGAPVANPDSAVTSQDTAVTIDILANDLLGPDPLSDLEITLVSINGTPLVDQRSTPANPLDDVVVYTPAPGFTGSDLFAYTIRDIDGSQSTANVTITVQPAGLPIATFAGPQRFKSATDLNPGPPAAGELTQNGFDDVVVPFEGGEAVVGVFLASGDGTLAEPILYPVASGATPTKVALVDTNSDGALDIVCLGRGDPGAISVLLNNGDGAFGGASILETLPDASDLEIADVTGDGEVDLVVASASFALGENTIGVHVGDGTDFAAVAPRGSLPGLLELAVDRIDGDALPDLLVAGSANSFAVQLNRDLEPGTFAAAESTATAQTPTAVVLADIDGAGGLDVLYRSPEGEVFFRRGNGLGAFEGPEAILTTATEGSLAGFFQLAVGDYNEDGDTDIAVTNSALFPAGRDDGGNLLLYINAGNGSFLAQPLRATTTSGPAVFGDFDGEGGLDLFSTNFPGNESAVVLSTDFNGFAKAPGFQTAGTPVTIATGNFDGILGPDLIVAGASATGANPLIVHLNSGPGVFSATSLSSIANVPRALITGELDGDAFSDIVVIQPPGTALLFENQDGGVPSDGVAVGPALASAAAFGRFDGDGRTDLAISNSDGPTLFFFSGAEGGGLETIGAATPIPVNLTKLVAGDFTGGPGLDLLGITSSSAELALLSGSGAGSFTPGGTFASGVVDVVAGRFNADSVDDFCAITNSQVSLFASSAPGVFDQQDQIVRLNLTSVSAGDYNQDGNLDCAVTAAGTNSVVVLYGDGRGSFVGQTTVGSGHHPSALVSGDFDGNTLPDLITTNEWSNDLSVLRSLP
ncbi:MAG: FG-GAP-like repeat-containing protein [Myxococcota bacterium]